MLGKTLLIFLVSVAATLLGKPVHASNNNDSDNYSPEFKCGDRRGYARFPIGKASCFNDEGCYTTVMNEGTSQIKSGDYLDYGKDNTTSGDDNTSNTSSSSSADESGHERRVVERRLWNCLSGGTEYYCLFDPRFAKGRQLRGLQTGEGNPFEEECWEDVTGGDVGLFKKQMIDIVGVTYQAAVPVSYSLQDYTCGCDNV